MSRASRAADTLSITAQPPRFFASQHRSQWEMTYAVRVAHQENACLSIALCLLVCLVSVCLCSSICPSLSLRLMCLSRPMPLCFCLSVHRHIATASTRSFPVCLCCQGHNKILCFPCLLTFCCSLAAISLHTRTRQNPPLPRKRRRNP